MREFLIRFVVNVIAIMLTVVILPGIQLVQGNFVALVVIAVIFGLINAFVRPIIEFFAAPWIILTMGFVIVLINACMLQVTAILARDFLNIDNLLWVLAGGLIIGLVAAITETLIDRMLARRRRQNRKRRRVDYRRF